MQASATGPYVLALVAAIKAQPRRAYPDSVIQHVLDKTMPDDLRAVLTTWRDHQVNSLRIGNFLMRDTYIREAFYQPVWRKDGRGPHADVYQVEGEVRQDLIALGWMQNKANQSGLVAVTYQGQTVDPRPIIATWSSLLNPPILEDFLAGCHKDALAAQKESALTSYLASQ
jgi:hypothetical protein